MNPNQQKIDDFVKEYGQLREKHQMDFFTQPIYVPDEQGGFRLTLSHQVVDLTQLPTPSPFIV